MVGAYCSFNETTNTENCTLSSQGFAYALVPGAVGWVRRAQPVYPFAAGVVPVAMHFNSFVLMQMSCNEMDFSGNVSEMKSVSVLSRLLLCAFI